MDNLSKKVSIITATYNLVTKERQNFFVEMFNSVHNQDYENIEHIIKDGGSTDGSIEFIKEIIDKYGKKNTVFISEKDSGIHNATNIGIKESKGVYFTLMCDDDFYVTNDAVSLSVKALDESGADFSYAPIYILRNNSMELVKPSWKHCFFVHPVGTATWFIKKSSLSEIKYFDESYKITGDYDLMMRMLLSGKRPVEVKKTISCFRFGGISTTDIEQVHKEAMRVMMTNFKWSKKQAYLAEYHRVATEKMIKKLLSKTIDFPDRDGLLSYQKEVYDNYKRSRFLSYKKRIIKVLISFIPVKSIRSHLRKMFNIKRG